MSELSHHTLTDHLLPAPNGQSAVERLHQHAYRRGQLALIWSALTRRPRHLLDWAEVESACSSGDCANVGKQRVQIHWIRGSVGRFNDFDTDFHPLNLQNQERWLKIARVRRAGAALPPVKLNQVGDTYFVQDGHHRISVAQALGYRDIEAQVTVYQVNGSLPWKQLTRTGARLQVRQAIGLIRQRARRDCHAWVTFFAERFTPWLRQGHSG